MVEKNIVISNKMGMHARASAQFIAYIQKFHCDIYLVKGEQIANAKSILNLIMLSLNFGTEVTVRVSGENEDEVLKKVTKYISEMED